MTEDKPKHKPQKKRTLEEVLKSLQDLIRTDLVSAPTMRQAWRDSEGDGATPASPEEPDTFQEALHHLDEVIKEKIIEPIQRAKETPPEPLLPEEELEIEWSNVDADGTVPGKDAVQIETVEITAPEPAAPEEEIEIGPVTAPEATLPELTDATAATGAAPPEVEPEATPTPTAEELSIVEPIISAAPIEPGPGPLETPTISEPQPTEDAAAPPSEETIDLSEAPAHSPEDTEGQRTFDFSASTQERNAGATVPTPPPTEPTPEPSREIPVTVELATAGDANVAAPVQPPPGRRGEPATRREKAPKEQPGTSAVEPKKRESDDPFTVEFMVEPPPAPEPTPPKPKTAPVAPPVSKERRVRNDAKPPPEDLALKKTPPPDESSKGATERRPPIAKTESPKAPSSAAPKGVDTGPDGSEIPVLKDIADLDAPPSAPLPEASQARDIAIRVIARLNIERRKAGESQLDIKTIERLQQYLADALSKRALNKLK